MPDDSIFGGTMDNNILANALLGPKRQSFWEALGRFIETFALLEGCMFILLQQRTGVTVEIARAIFSGTRIDAAMNTIRRMNEASSGERIDPYLEEAFLKVAELLSARNDIVHLGPLFGDDYERFVTNGLKALTPKKIKHQIFSSETLQMMTHDAYKAATHILASLNDVRLKEIPPYMKQVLEREWLYKKLSPQ